MCLLLPRGWQRAGQGRGKKGMRWRGLGAVGFCFPAPFAWTRARAHQLCWVVRRWLLLVDLESTVMAGSTGHTFPGFLSPGSTEHAGCTRYTQCNQWPPQISRSDMKIWLGPLGLEGAEGVHVDISPTLSGSHWRIVISSASLPPSPTHLHTAPAQPLLQIPPVIS